MAISDKDLQDLLNLYDELDLQDGDLDNEVHGSKSKEASDINNGGAGAQITYLLESGYEVESLKDMFGIIAEENKGCG